MENETKKVLSAKTCEFLATTWIQQQNLQEKSPVEVADMYYAALKAIWEKYQPPAAKPATSRHVRSHGIQQDDW